MSIEFDVYRPGALADMVGLHARYIAKNRGLGKYLIGQALNYCRSQKFGNIWLETFAGLDAAKWFCEIHGFVLKSESDTSVWRAKARGHLFELHKSDVGAEYE